MSAGNRIIGLLEARVRQARAIQDLFQDEPETARSLIIVLVHELAKSLELKDEAQPMPQRAGTTIQLEPIRKKSHWAVVSAFLADNGNRWISVPDLARKLKIHRGTVGGLFYTTHAGAVESKAKPGVKRGRLWRLKKPD